jgi:hypothetical protein
MPAFEYTDQFLRTRRVPIAKKADQVAGLKPGFEIEDGLVYYFEYTVNPKIGDEIFEVDLTDHRITNPRLTSVNYIERYKILRVHPYRLESADIMYWAAITKFEEMVA